MNLLKPAFNTFFKSKHLIINIVSISLVFGIIISLFYCMVLLNDLLEDKIKNNIINRVIYVSGQNFSDADIEKINNLDNIDKAYKGIVTGKRVILDKSYSCSLWYCMPEEIKDISKGSLFDNSETYQVIIPNYIYDTTGVKKDLSEYIGKEVEINVDNNKIFVNVVGVQNDNSSYLYINQNLKNYLVNINSKLESKDYIFAIVDNYKNVDSVIYKLKTEFGYSSNLSNINGLSDIKLYNIASFLVILVLIFAIAFNYISISLIISGIINDEVMDIAILKSIGYKVKDIYIIIKYRILAILGISYVFSLFVSLVVNNIVKFVLKYKLDIIIKDSYNMFICDFLAFGILVYVLSILCLKFNNRKIKKINAVILLKEN